MASGSPLSPRRPGLLDGFRAARWLRADFSISAALLPRGLALIYLLAFGSWAVQVDALVGSQGIAPAHSFLAAVQAHFTSEEGHAWLRVPTIFHLGISDGWLRASCLLGMLFAALALLGVATAPNLSLLWILYLSHAGIGGVFLSFQWDALLLEAGLIAPLLASWRPSTGLRPRPHSRPWPVFLVQLLLGKLFFLSGLVKLTSGDPSWLEGTALTYHYETQPLPHAVSWYAHQLPLWFHKLSGWIMLGIELILPWFVFLGRVPRLLAAAGFTGLMLLIQGTGNFTWFNLLTAILCLSLIDDRSWNALSRGRLAPAGPPAHARWLPALLGLPVAVFSLLAALPGFLPAKQTLAPFRCFNSYGLFRVMTKERPEILLETSSDGIRWEPCDFRWKPDDPAQAPLLVAPHQPRLDWQLWFAALEGRYQRSSRTVWFEGLMAGLLENRPGVTRLFRALPGDGSPPRFLRARLCRYRFTTPAERRETGHWWKREDLGLYFPVVERRRIPPSASPAQPGTAPARLSKDDSMVGSRR